MNSFGLDYLCKDSVSKYNNILGSWGLGFQPVLRVEGGTQFNL